MTDWNRELSIPSHGATPQVIADVPAAVAGRLLEQRGELETLTAQAHALKQILFLQSEVAQSVIDDAESSIRLLDTVKSLDREDRVFVERFDSLRMVDPSSTAYVDTVRGTLTLNPIGKVDITTSLESIDCNERESIGIPGNNSVVRVFRADTTTGAASEPYVELDGDPDNHGHEISMFDGNPDTWYEWERVIVKDVQQVSAAGTAYVRGGPAAKLERVADITSGFGWDVKVAYPGAGELRTAPLMELLPAPDNKPARMDFTFRFSDPVHGHWMQLDAIPVGHVPVKVVKLEVSNDGMRWITVAENDVITDRTGVRRYYLGDADIRYVHLVMESLGFYKPRLGLGHIYAYRLLKITKKKFLFGIRIDKRTSHRLERIPAYDRAVGSLVVRDETSNVVRLAGAYLGYELSKVLPVGKWVAGAITKSGVGKLIEQVVSGILKAPVNLGSIGAAIAVGLLVALGSLIYRESVDVEVEKTGAHIDVFDGWRSAIGIREISFFREEYDLQGVFLSKEIVMTRPVTVLKLLANYDQPEGTQVEFAVRSGDGEWIPIRPFRAGGVESVAKFDTPVQSVYLRATLKSDSKERTPVIYSLGLEGA